MTAATSPEQQQAWAEQAVERFLYRFGDAHGLLAYHAALPLVLTPELLNYLRSHFLYGQVPWEAEVDLLLSELCQPAGYELYTMTPAMRAHRLHRLEQTPELGQPRMQAVARLLISYVRYLYRANPALQQQELQTQQWAAMVFLPEQRQQAATEIAAALTAAIAPNSSPPGQGLIDPAELARLSQLTQTLGQQLQTDPRYRDLIRYAELVGRLLRSPDPITNRDPFYQTYSVGDSPLPPLASLLPEEPTLDTAVDEADTSDAGADALLSDFPLLQSREFDTGEFVPDDGDIFPPPLEAIEVEVGTLSIEAEPEPEPEPDRPILQSFRFDIITVDERGQEIDRQPGEAQSFTETAIPNLELELVAIPGSSFLMGSPRGEAQRASDEGPQHEVSIPPFFIGKYPITQAQWRIVASLPQLKRSLKTSPSHFRGENCPVEQISWDDAVEFCARLAQITGRAYRLPNEAEWEYACRAGTETPFHFGATLTPDLANYNGKYAYAQGPTGEYRRRTTPVGSFPPNGFGLYDMHGNVWEWCADLWHGSYTGAPADGSAWIDDENNNHSHLVRGGPWVLNPWCCRSACRFRYAPGYGYGTLGLRVVCSGP